MDYTQVDRQCAGPCHHRSEPWPHQRLGLFLTADYVTVTGDPCADPMSNIASEQRRQVVYEYLYCQIEDKKVRETIDFLLNREEAHNALFQEARFPQGAGHRLHPRFRRDGRLALYANMSTPSPEEHFDRSWATPPSIRDPNEKDREPSLPAGNLFMPLLKSYGTFCRLLRLHQVVMTPAVRSAANNSLTLATVVG